MLCVALFLARAFRSLSQEEGGRFFKDLSIGSAMILKKSNILTNQFVDLVEDNYQVITERFMTDLLKDPSANAYQHLDRQMIYEAAYQRLHDISKWILKKYPKQEIERYYKQVARERFAQGVPFSQAFRFLVLLKRHIWLYVLNHLYANQGVYEQAIDLNNRVVLYFDRAAFYMLQGYEEMQKRKW